MTASPWPMAQDERLSEAIGRDASRLARFIRSRVPDARDAEDILQEVFYELVNAYRMTQPIEEVSAWLFRVARNRITDLPAAGARSRMSFSRDDESTVEELLPSRKRVPRRSSRAACCSKRWPTRWMSCPPSARDLCPRDPGVLQRACAAHGLERDGTASRALCGQYLWRSGDLREWTQDRMQR